MLSTRTIGTPHYGFGGSTVEFDGTVTNNGQGVNISLLSANDKLIIKGNTNLSNGGAISTPTLINGGIINVDANSLVRTSSLLVGIGQTSFTFYNYIQLGKGTSGAGTLGEIINSYISFGQINLNGGKAELAGTLDILLDKDFNPELGKVFEIIIGAEGITGTFEDIHNRYFNNGQWDVGKCGDGSCVYLIADPYVPVPEPATLLVLIPGLLGVGYGLRRKLLG